MKQITFLFLIGGLLCWFSSCASETERRSFRGIYVDDPAGTEGLYNPERGFRLEVALDVANKNYVWNPKQYPDITSYLESESQTYASDSVALVQTYFYLTDLAGKDLSEEDMEAMNDGQREQLVNLEKEAKHIFEKENKV